MKPASGSLGFSLATCPQPHAPGFLRTECEHLRINQTTLDNEYLADRIQPTHERYCQPRGMAVAVPSESDRDNTPTVETLTDRTARGNLHHHRRNRFHHSVPKECRKPNLDNWCTVVH
jgi:hypothetical protein